MRRNSEGLEWRILCGIAVAVAVAMLYTVSARTLTQSVGGADYGYTPNPAGTREFLGELDRPTFAQAGAESIQKATGVDTFLYRYADKVSRIRYGKPFACWNQGSAGTCVSFAWAMGSWIGQSTDFCNGEVGEAPLMVATENIYGGSRTIGRVPPVTFAGYSWGSYGAAAARYVCGTKDGRGGILYRQKYPECDLTQYSINVSRDWGATGCPDTLNREANKHTARGVALVEDWQSLCASVEAGWPVAICSNVGFAASRTRSADGFLKRGGTWSHAMLIAGVRHAKNSGGKDGALVVNSWGTDWLDEKNSGRWPADQPAGTFWISRADAETIFSQGDSFSIAGVNGFKWRQLNHGEWMTPADPATLTGGTVAPAPGFAISF
jgi:hypothetical protein